MSAASLPKGMVSDPWSRLRDPDRSDDPLLPPPLDFLPGLHHLESNLPHKFVSRSVLSTDFSTSIIPPLDGCTSVLLRCTFLPLCRTRT